MEVVPELRKVGDLWWCGTYSGTTPQEAYWRWLTAFQYYTEIDDGKNV